MPRSGRACITCRRRGQKCDMTHPSCHACASHSVLCDGYSIRWIDPLSNSVPLSVPSPRQPSNLTQEAGDEPAVFNGSHVRLETEALSSQSAAHADASISSDPVLSSARNREASCRGCNTCAASSGICTTSYPASRSSLTALSKVRRSVGWSGKCLRSVTRPKRRVLGAGGRDRQGISRPVMSKLAGRASTACFIISVKAFMSLARGPAQERKCPLLVHEGFLPC